MVEAYPIIKVNQPSIINVWKGLPINGIIIRLQDLINIKTLKPNKIFYTIKECGGIHQYLGFYKTIIISAVMRDEIIRNFSEQQYAEIINGIKPDYYMTPDGETYEGEEIFSQQEIKRCLMQTVQLSQLCPDSKPIGQIKGCTHKQILIHIYWLKRMGINDFVFHIGDFFRYGKRSEINKAKEYSLLIREHANKLILYGISSPRKMPEYAFADAYASLGYFTTAVHGRRYKGYGISNVIEPYSMQLVKQNLQQMILFTQNLKCPPLQKKLFEGGVCLWAGELEAIGLDILEIPVMAQQRI